MRRETAASSHRDIRRREVACRVTEKRERTERRKTRGKSGVTGGGVDSEDGCEDACSKNEWIPVERTVSREVGIKQCEINEDKCET